MKVNKQTALFYAEVAKLLIENFDDFVLDDNYSLFAPFLIAACNSSTEALITHSPPDQAENFQKELDKLVVIYG